MMTKSTVVDNETGKSVDSTVRTSTGTFFARGQDHTIAEVEKRISMVRPHALCMACGMGLPGQSGPVMESLLLAQPSIQGLSAVGPEQHLPAAQSMASSRSRPECGTHPSLPHSAVKTARGHAPTLKVNGRALWL